MLGSVGLGLGSVGTAAGQGNGAGGGDLVDDTLAKIWAFGAGDDPLADNVFNMPTGNMRFVGSTSPNLLPASGFFESSTTAGDTRIGTDYFARFYPLGAHIGGTTFDQFDGYDPSWNGTFRGMDGIQHIATQVGFSNGSGAQTGPTPGLVVGREVWWNIFGFFDGTDYWPIVGFNNGAREDIRWDLYNESEGVAAERGRLTGWGTWIGRPRVEQHGTTAALDTQVQFQIVGGTAAGDGVGWFVRNNTGDPPEGIARWFWLANGNASGWEFLSQDTGGTLSTLLTLDHVNGAVFNVPVSLPDTAAAAYLASYRTAKLDFTTVADNIAIAIPQRAGFFFVPRSGAVFITDAVGAATAGTFQVLLGNNAAHNNAGQTSATAPATWNTVVAAAPNTLNIGVTSTLAGFLDSSAQFFVKIGSVLTGVISAHGYVEVSGFWVTTA